MGTYIEEINEAMKELKEGKETIVDFEFYAEDKKDAYAAEDALDKLNIEYDTKSSSEGVYVSGSAGVNSSKVNSFKKSLEKIAKKLELIFLSNKIYKPKKLCYNVFTLNSWCDK